MPDLRQVELPNARYITIDIYLETSQSLHIAFVTLVGALIVPKLQSLTIDLEWCELRTQEFDWVAAARILRALTQPAASSRGSTLQPLIHIQVSSRDWNNWDRDRIAWPIQAGLEDLVNDGLLAFEGKSSEELLGWHG